MRELRYPANWLTLVRLLLLPPTIVYLRRPDGRLPALLCMGTALLTDAIDGPLARYRGEVSPLGKVLDPIADKLMLNITMLTLVRTRAFPWRRSRARTGARGAPNASRGNGLGRRKRVRPPSWMPPCAPGSNSSAC